MRILRTLTTALVLCLAPLVSHGTFSLGEGFSAFNPNSSIYTAINLQNDACIHWLELGGTTPIEIFCVDTSDDLNIGHVTGINNINFTSALNYTFLMNPAGTIVITGLGRTIDTGTMRFEQSPAIANTRAVTINVDANSQPNTHAFVVNYVATGLAAGEAGHAFAIALDKSTSTGGEVHGLLVTTAGAGSAIAQAVHVGIDVIPIHQESGSFGNLEQGHTESGGLYVDITTASASTGTDATMFAADNDALYIGDAATFTTLEFNLDTTASGPGIKPTFEFSDGAGGWTTFTPVDETVGMRQTGTMIWEVSDLSGWATDPTPPALGSVTLDTGSAGSVDGITVNAVQVMSGAESFDTSLTITAAAVAANIVAHTSAPNYTAYSTGAVVTIQAIATGTGVNGFVVVSTTTTIGTTDVNMAGGTADKYSVRITRTQNTLATSPVEDTIQIASGTDYEWNATGDLTINSVTMDSKETLFVPASAMIASFTAGSSLLQTVETTAGRPDMNVLDFDPSTEEHAQFHFAFPKRWNLGTITFSAYHTTAAGRTGGLDGVVWGLQCVAIGADDTIDVAYGTEIEVSTNVAQTEEDVWVTAESAAVTIAGTPVVGKLNFCQTSRVTGSGTDDMDIDARLLGILFFWTSTKQDDS